MKTSVKQKPLQWISNQYKKGNISFTHKLQRPVGQWNNSMKSLLIHSLLIGFPINPIYVIEEDGIIYTLDGSQRTSACIDFINDKFALNKNTPAITLYSNVDGDPKAIIYDISGKKFSKLDEEVKSTLLSSSLEFCYLTEYEDDDVREMFRRQNSGKSLSNKLLRIVKETDEFSSMIYNFVNHAFMKKLVTPTQHKSGTDRDLIVQTFMLILSNQENNYTSFRSKDIDNFIVEHQDECIEKSDVLKDVFDKFDGYFETINMPLTSIPMMLYCGYRVVKDKQSFTKLVEVINSFIANYDTNEEYKAYTISGTSDTEKVNARFKYWKNLI